MGSIIQSVGTRRWTSQAPSNSRQKQCKRCRAPPLFLDGSTMIDTITVNSGFWPEAVSNLSDWLYFDRKNSLPTLAKDVRNLFDRMLPTDPIELAILFTNGLPADFHDPDTDYDREPNAKHDFDYSSRQATLVAKKIAQDASQVRQAVESLACSDAKSVLPFSRQLIQSVHDPAALFAIARQLLDHHTRQQRSAHSRAYRGQHSRSNRQ